MFYTLSYVKLYIDVLTDDIGAKGEWLAGGSRSSRTTPKGAGLNRTEDGTPAVQQEDVADLVLTHR